MILFIRRLHEIKKLLIAKKPNINAGDSCCV